MTLRISSRTSLSFCDFREGQSNSTVESVSVCTVHECQSETCRLQMLLIYQSMFESCMSPCLNSMVTRITGFQYSKLHSTEAEARLRYSVTIHSRTKSIYKASYAEEAIIYRGQRMRRYQKNFTLRNRF